MSIVATVSGLPKPARIALAIGGALAVAYALWYVADAFGLLPNGIRGLLMPDASADPAAPVPTEAAPPPTTSASAARTTVGTDSTGAPIFGTGRQSIDKGAAAVANRAIASARRLVS